MRDTSYVVVLNYRGTEDTIACLASLMNSRGARFRVIVCDNASGDGSLEGISAWARGERPALRPDHARLARLVAADPSPVAFECIGEETAISGKWRVQVPLTLVQNKENGGFASGNNVGIRLAMAQPDMHSLWLLNNDTLVEPDCLLRLRERLAECDERAVVGNRIHFFDDPYTIQALGGNRFDRLTGAASESLGRFQPERLPRNIEHEEAQLHYISGCSMLLPRAFLDEVGLMNDDYFLYYEEIDWFTRAEQRFPCRIADRAVLYHREGSAIGSANYDGGASAFSEYHMYRSRLLFMRRYYPLYLPLAMSRGIAEAGLRVLQGRGANATAIIRSMLGLGFRQETAQ